MHKKSSERISVATFLLILMFTLVIAIFPYEVKAVETKIQSISPISQRGLVGDSVRITGTIETKNGNYNIFFDKELVVENMKAVEDFVETTFLVPHISTGNYTLTLQDIEKNSNATTWFFVDTGFHIKAALPDAPKQLQEGDSVQIWVNVTGGEKRTSYHANVTVKDPMSNIFSTSLVELVSGENGDGSENVTYPQAFSGAHTNFTGTYNLMFNETAAKGSFFVGITNASEYHRYNVVDMRAIGYLQEEPANVTITFGDKTVNSTIWNASDVGVVYANWTIDGNASIGDYKVTIANTTTPGTVKSVPDVQFFRVPGFSVNILTQNLNEELASGVRVDVYHVYLGTTTYVDNKTSADGAAKFALETGDYNCTAMWKEAQVGKIEQPFSINETGPWNITFTCSQLASAQVEVIDGKTGNMIPFINITLSCVYNTTAGDERNETESYETNINATLRLKTMLVNASYDINASRYGFVFNTTHVEPWPAERQYNITIVCPVKMLFVHVFDVKDNMLPDVRVIAIDWMSGLINSTDSGTTNQVGEVHLSCTLGRYKLRVYHQLYDVILNETVIDLFHDYAQGNPFEIHCKTYPLTLSVKVVDYFGQPISNIIVKTEREGMAVPETPTDQSGTATFHSLIGGDCKISIYVGDENVPCKTEVIHLEKAETMIEFKIEKFAIIAGYLLETRWLTTIILTCVIAAFVATTLIYKKLRRKKTAEKEEKTGSSETS